MDKIKLGEQLRRLRQAAGLTMRETAERAQINGQGFSHSTVGAIETGVANPSLDMLDMIVFVLGGELNIEIGKQLTGEARPISLANSYELMLRIARALEKATPTEVDSLLAWIVSIERDAGLF